MSYDEICMWNLIGNVLQFLKFFVRVFQGMQFIYILDIVELTVQQIYFVVSTLF